MVINDLIKRYYTKELEGTKKTVFDLFEWKKVTVNLVDHKTGKAIYHKEDLEFPVFFSQNACDIIASKYFKKTGVPNGYGYERSLKEPVHRMVNFWVTNAIEEGLISKEEYQVLYDELAYGIINQMWSPNSPQWFNTGLKLAYNIDKEADGHFYFDEKLGKVIPSKDAYTRTQGSACFIVSIEDKLLGNKSITDQVVTETRLFKHGSGVGTNFSTIRGKGEKLSGGGTSSGLISFLKVFDRNAGAIKSGGTCLAPYQKVFTDRGAIPVKELAESNEEFIVLSYDPPANRYKAKKGTAWLSGNKEVVRIYTDKGHFDVTYDHPIKLASGEFIKAEDLKEGMSLFAGTIYDDRGYVRVNLKDGNKGKRRWHQMILEDVYGYDLTDKSTHHKDEIKTNNHISNLEVINQSEHAYSHSMEKVSNHEHTFQVTKFSKKGSDNPMHSSNDFWKNEDKVTQFKQKQSEILKSNNRAKDMQKISSYQKMLNIGYKLINNDYDISTFDNYINARTEFIGRIGSIKKVESSINNFFGSYEDYLKELKENNHRVIKIERIGVMDVYDIEVQCPTLDDKSPQTGHNFLIWSIDNESDYFGTGIVVANTRRSAKMLVLDDNHPDLMEYIEWKTHEEQKVRDLGKMGYDISFEGEAYDTVSGQNANNSVRFSNRFMKKLTSHGYDRDWLLTGRVDNSVDKLVNIDEVWNKFNKSAWECADPAVQYDDTINAWHTCPAGEDGKYGAKHNRINASNPCSEYFFLDDTACNLASINLLKFYNEENGTFDVHGFLHFIGLVQIVLETTIYGGQFPTEDIARKSYLFRTTGLGLANAGALLMRMAIPYDSEEGRNVISSIMGIITGHSYYTSSLMAKKVGTFQKYDINKHHMLRVIKNHGIVSGAYNENFVDLDYTPLKINHLILHTLGFGNVSNTLKEVWKNAFEYGQLYGYRNAQVSVIAPK